jgi:hypothetical protein
MNNRRTNWHSEGLSIIFLIWSIVPRDKWDIVIYTHTRRANGWRMSLSYRLQRSLCKNAVHLALITTPVDFIFIYLCSIKYVSRILTMKQPKPSFWKFTFGRMLSYMAVVQVLGKVCHGTDTIFLYPQIVPFLVLQQDTYRQKRNKT